MTSYILSSILDPRQVIYISTRTRTAPLTAVSIPDPYSYILVGLGALPMQSRTTPELNCGTMSTPR